MTGYTPRLMQALTDAGIPFFSVMQLIGTGPFDPNWHVVVRSDFSVKIDYLESATQAQRDQGDQIALTLPAGPYGPRPLYTIRADVAALSTGQFSNLWNDLSAAASPAPKKYLLDAGPNAATIFCYDHVIYVVGGTAAQIRAGQLSLTACYIQDNPSYAVHPPFDTSINIPGDMPA